MYHKIKSNRKYISESLLILLKQSECDIIIKLGKLDLNLFKEFNNIGDDSGRLLRYAIKTKRIDLVQTICDVYNTMRSNAWIFYDIYTSNEYCNELKQSGNTEKVDEMKKILEFKLGQLNKNLITHNEVYSNLFNIIKKISQYNIIAHGNLSITGNSNNLSQIPFISEGTFIEQSFRIPYNIFLGVLTESGNKAIVTEDFFHPSACTRIYLPTSRILKIKLDFKFSFPNNTFQSSGIFDIKNINTNTQQKILEKKKLPISENREDNINTYSSEFNLLNPYNRSYSSFNPPVINKSKKIELEDLLNEISTQNKDTIIFIILGSCRYGKINIENGYNSNSETLQTNGIKILPSFHYLDIPELKKLKKMQIYKKNSELNKYLTNIVNGLS